MGEAVSIDAIAVTRRDGQVPNRSALLRVGSVVLLGRAQSRWVLLAPELRVADAVVSGFDVSGE